MEQQSNSNMIADPKDCKPSLAGAFEGKTFSIVAKTLRFTSPSLISKRRVVVVDWRKILTEASDPNTKKSMGIKWPKLAELSGYWITCACGNQCIILPRGRNGAPSDPILSKLGITFCSFIKRKDPIMALKILDAIEERSAILIKQIYELQQTYKST